MSEAMKQRMIQWAEDNPDKANALQIAKIGLDKMKDMDKFAEHFLTDHSDTDIEEYLKSISKAKISVVDD